MKTNYTGCFFIGCGVWYHNFFFSSKMFKNQSFFRKNTSFTYWPITKHIVMTQLWSIPYSIAYHLPKKMRYRWTKSGEKWRQETQSKSTTNKKHPVYYFIGWRYSVPCNWYQFTRCSWLGDDAVLFRASFHASVRKTRKVGRTTTILCDCTTYRHKKASWEFCLQV